MMVTFISQCEKNALKKTRRILDTFAERIGDNAWQTIITEDGLSVVRKMLSKSASKNTAVSCHWIRSRSRNQCLWIVGNHNKFGERGIVPVHRTRKNMIKFENDWYYLPLIKSLSALAALFHDWGKASSLFQDKLKKNSKEGDPVRHEWISCLLLNALIKISGDHDNDLAWLTVLTNGGWDDMQVKNVLAQKEEKPMASLPCAAKLIAWLVVSHHRLPLPKDSKNYRDYSVSSIDDIFEHITQEWSYENEDFNSKNFEKRLNACFEFPYGLLSESSVWLKQLKKWAKRLQEDLPKLEYCMSNGSYRLLLHHARLCLMLGDHNYSSQEADPDWDDTTGMFANTDKDSKKVKQKLDEHLVGVSGKALCVAHLLPTLEQELPVAQNVKALKKASPLHYNWQDKVVKKIKLWREQEGKRSGFFVVNMASTGCGKTFANAKIMRALSVDGESLRYILALGLITLALQTGDEYRNRIGLDDSELAVLIGSKAIMELHNQKEESENGSYSK